MLRRIALIFALAAIAVPAASRAHEWEEDYTDDEWTGDAPPPGAPADADVDVDVSVTFDTFQGALSPYGEWVVAGSYGKVWRPRVVAGWRPYYYGRWEWTNEGWLWVSDEPFGWAAYHYGRWAMDPYYGWIWVPGYQWAPAWVSWRYSGDVVGWAPLGPGVSVYVSVTTFRDSWWTFVPCHSFVAVPVHRVAYQPGFARRYWRATTPAPAYRGRPHGHDLVSPAWGGPPPRTIEQRIGRRVTPVRVVQAPRPGPSRVGNGEVAIYRPGGRGWQGQRGEPGRPAIRQDDRSAFRRDDRPAFRHDDRPVFRNDGGRPDDARRGPAVRGDDARPRFPSRGDAARGDRAQPDRAVTPTPAPAPRQDAPRFEPRGGTPPGGAPAPRAERQGGARGGGEVRQGGARGGGEFRQGGAGGAQFRRGGGEGGGAPRAMAPRRGGEQRPRGARLFDR